MTLKRFLLALVFIGTTSFVASAEEPTPLELRLATFNVRFPSDDDGENRWEHRRQLFFETFRSLDADVVGVQEAYASQLKEIVEEIPEYAYVGVARDDGKEAGEFSAILYRKKRFDVKDQSTFWLSDTPDVVGSNTWEAACNRVSTWIHLVDRATQREVAIYNAHFDHKSKLARENSPKCIVEQIRKNKHDEIPLILMGDFNSTPQTPQMQYLLNAETSDSPIAFEDTLRGEEEGQQATFHGWEGRTQGAPIDFVLVAGSPTIVEGKIVRHHEGERYPSDHYPVTAHVRYDAQ